MSGDLPDAGLTKAQRVFAAMQTLQPDGRRFCSEDNEAIAHALVAGFVEEREQRKPCRSCGTSLVDFRHLKITVGGRLFMDACATPTDSTVQP